MNKEKIAEAFGRLDDQMITDALDYKCERGQIVMSKKKLAAIIAAAAVTVLLTVSVAAAATFTGLMSKEDVLDTAVTYVVMHEDNGAKLAEYIFEGLSYGESSDETEVTLGLSGLRPVYNVKFKVGGQEYTVTVDAKTSVVLDCKTDVDTGWDEHLRNANYKESDAPTQEDIDSWDDSKNVINSSQAMLIARDYTGLSESGLYQCGEALGTSHCGPIYGTDPQRYEFVTNHGGYRYSVIVNAETAEVMSCDIELKSSNGGHTHEADTEHISSYDATVIAAEYFRSVGFDDCTPADIFHVSFFRRTDKIAEKIAGVIIHGFDMSHLRGDFYVLSYDHDNHEIYESLFIDAYTGVIVSVKTSYPEPNLLRPNQDVSTIAPEGMISEATAKAIALSDAGVKDTSVYGFEITLDCDVYRLSYQRYARRDVLNLYSYVINAENGDIIETDVCEIANSGRPTDEELENQKLKTEAPDGMISEADAVAIALGNSVVSEYAVNEYCVWSLRVNLADGVYKISYLFGYDDFVEETTGTWDLRTNTYEIDAVTGEILSFDALTPDDYISEDTALAIAYELAGISEDDVERVVVEFEIYSLFYPQYSVTLYSSWGMIYHYNLDAVNGNEHVFVR